MCSYERTGWLGSVSGLEILPYEHFNPVTGRNDRTEGSSVQFHLIVKVKFKVA